MHSWGTWELIVFSEPAYTGEDVSLPELTGRHKFDSKRNEKSILVVIVYLEEISDFVNLHKYMCLKTS